MKIKIKSLLGIGLLAAALAAGLTACSEAVPEETTEITEEETTMEETMDIEAILAKKYSGPYAENTGTLSGIDSLGRILPLDVTVEEREDGVSRSVGIFYFLWMGQHGTGGPYDNSIISQVPGATASEAAWMAAGGGNVGETHFWGKPMFGYYTSNDQWVMRKHVQMLTDAGIDYVVFDTTNGYIYEEQALNYLRISKSFYDQGFDVPKVAFYTNSGSGNVINAIYERIYKAHPEYEELWFRWDGKPMIVGVQKDTAISAEAKEFFRIKASQWPNSPKLDDGFPWMEFDRYQKTSAVYGLNKVKEVLNISPAQHNATCTMSATAFYGAKDRARSYSVAEMKNLYTDEAFLSGVNFAGQWTWALRQNVQSIFVTGWNEWGAQRQPSTLNKKYPIYFVDCCTPETSRDIEPMEGGFGDNYYMQLIDGIRRFKGTDGRVDIGGYTTVDIKSENAFDAATAVYKDYTQDIVDRNCAGFGTLVYTDASGLNDFDTLSVLRDKDNLYFSAKVNGKVVDYTAAGRMTLFIKCGDEESTAINGYNYAINRGASSVDRADIEHWNGSAWEKIGEAGMSVNGDRLSLSVSRELLGLDGAKDGEYDLISLEFKWADGYDENDVFSFYTRGDAAPLGRLNYLYSNIADSTD